MNIDGYYLKESHTVNFCTKSSQPPPPPTPIHSRLSAVHIFFDLNVHGYVCTYIHRQEAATKKRQKTKRSLSRRKFSQNKCICKAFRFSPIVVEKDIGSFSQCDDYLYDS